MSSAPLKPETSQNDYRIPRERMIDRLRRHYGIVDARVLDAMRAVLEVRLRLGWASAADLLEAVLGLAGALALARAGAGPRDFVVLWVVLKLLNALVVTAAALRMGTFDWRPRPTTCRATTARSASWHACGPA